MYNMCMFDNITVYPSVLVSKLSTVMMYVSLWYHVQKFPVLVHCLYERGRYRWLNKEVICICIDLAMWNFIIEVIHIYYTLILNLYFLCKSQYYTTLVCDITSWLQYDTLHVYLVEYCIWQGLQLYLSSCLI